MHQKGSSYFSSRRSAVEENHYKKSTIAGLFLVNSIDKFCSLPRIVSWDHFDLLQAKLGFKKLPTISKSCQKLLLVEEWKGNNACAECSYYFHARCIHYKDITALFGLGRFLNWVYDIRQECIPHYCNLRARGTRKGETWIMFCVEILPENFSERFLGISTEKQDLVMESNLRSQAVQ